MDAKGDPGIKAIADQMGALNKHAKSLNDSFGFLKTGFGSFLGALGIREIASMSDEMQNLSNRLKIVAAAGEDTKQTMTQLLNLANETQQSVSAVSEIYVRLGSSLKAANVSSGSMLEITRALINSFRISGSTGVETTATIVQLSQAFASGTLRGQELRSVMLQNAELAKLLRERFGKNLAKDAEAGLISIVEVLKLLRANQERINESAKTLTPTFEQTLTKAFNIAKIAIHGVNEEFQLAAKFATFIDKLTVSVGTFFKVVSDLGRAAVADLDFTKWAAGAFAFLAVLNPLVASLILVSGAAYATSDSFGDFVDKIRNVGAWITQLRAWLLELSFTIEKSFTKVLFKVGMGTDQMIRDLAGQMDQIKDLTDLATTLGTPKYRPSPLRDIGGIDPEKSKKEFEELLKRLQAMYGSVDKIKKLKEILGEINQEFLKGAITAGQYNEKLISFNIYKLNREFAEGKFDLEAYNQKFQELRRQEITREFNNARLSLEGFNLLIASSKITDLTAQLDAGKISLMQFNIEMAKLTESFSMGGAFRAGTSSYLESLGTVTQQLAGTIQNAFKGLEDAFIDFTKRGKFNFAQFTSAILDDLTRIIIRASIIQPLANGLLGSFTTAAATSVPQASGGYGGGQYAAPGFAKGGVFDSGIVTAPTAFSYGGGKPGVMGEKGPEAILPLTRGPGGSLGVQASVTPVNINIINNATADVQQRESTGPNGEKSIEIIITNKVREGITSGRFDKAFNQSFGMNRKGS